MEDKKSKSSPICIEVKAQYKRSELGRKLERVQKAQEGGICYAKKRIYLYS